MDAQSFGPCNMTRPRPKCAHCGQQYGERARTTETVKFTSNKPPPYTGDQIVVKKSVPYRTGDGDMVMYLRLWDGKTYHLPHDPFCTMRCALDYARLAFRRIGPIK
jgi:hypothetical protein